MKIAIMQPTFFPWIGYFELMREADAFVFLDDVQVSKQSWQTRNIFRINGVPSWLSIPLNGSSHSALCDIRLGDYEKFFRKFTKTILQNYARSQHLSDIEKLIRSLSDRNFETLAKFNEALIENMAEMLSISVQISRSSEMQAVADRNEKILEIVSRFPSPEYLASPGARGYMEAYGLENYPFTIRFFEYDATRALLEPTRLGYESCIDTVSRIGISGVRRALER